MRRIPLHSIRLQVSFGAAFLLLAATGFAARSHEGGGLTRAVIQEINRARTNPQAYAAYLETWRSHYSADGYLQFSGEPAIRTKEGVGALEEAIKVMRRTSPLPPLSASRSLEAAARVLADEQARTGAIGHGGSLPARIARCGIPGLSGAGEDVAYGQHSAQRIVASLVIDDGVSSRGHRHNILDGNFNLAGASIASHPVYGAVCVIDFAGSMPPQ
jgi:uncharacterized protein YkwD